MALQLRATRSCWSFGMIVWERMLKPFQRQSSFFQDLAMETLAHDGSVAAKGLQRVSQQQVPHACSNANMSCANSAARAWPTVKPNALLESQPVGSPSA